MTEDYSPNAFYTHATDEKGHSSGYRLSVPPFVAAEISELIASRKVAEYTTPQHFLRDAAFHRLQWVTDNVLYDASRTLKLWEVQMLIEQAKERIKLGKKIISDTNYLRLNARSDADRKELRELVVIALASDIPEDVHWELRRFLNDDTL